MVEKEAETARRKAIIEAEKEAQVAKIQFEQKIMEKESQQKMEIIEDTIHLAKERGRADSAFYHSSKLAEANSVLFTKEYLDLKKYQYISNNNKIYFGNDIPTMFVQSGISEPVTAAIAKDHLDI